MPRMIHILEMMQPMRDDYEELRAFVHVDILPVLDWDNTRWDLAFCVFELRNPAAFSPVHLKWL